MMGSYINLYISTLVPIWELATCCDVTEGTDWCGLVLVVREFLHMKREKCTKIIWSKAKKYTVYIDVFNLMIWRPPERSFSVFVLGNALCFFFFDYWYGNRVRCRNPVMRLGHLRPSHFGHFGCNIYDVFGLTRVIWDPYFFFPFRFCLRIPACFHILCGVWSGATLFTKACLSENIKVR